MPPDIGAANLGSQKRFRRRWKLGLERVAMKNRSAGFVRKQKPAEGRTSYIR
jgi:hypothetical protein